MFGMIFLSFFVAFVLSVLPMPEGLEAWRPAYIAVLVVYWCAACPKFFSIATGAGIGLLQDIVQGTLLGQHALSMSIMVYCSFIGMSQILSAGMGWQMIYLALMLIVHQSVELLVYWIVYDHSPNILAFYQPLIASVLLWPILCIIFPMKSER